MNINFKRLLYSPLGQILISILLGLGNILYFQYLPFILPSVYWDLTQITWILKKINLLGEF